MSMAFGMVHYHGKDTIFHGLVKKRWPLHAGGCLPELWAYLDPRGKIQAEREVKAWDGSNRIHHPQIDHVYG